MSKSGLNTLQLHRLDLACQKVWDAFGDTYLVGTADSSTGWRDVDVRTILDDERFDAMFGGEDGKAQWGLVCFTIGYWLTEVTGLPVDYQIQRMTEANTKFPNRRRNPIGFKRDYAGGGDATKFVAETTSEGGRVLSEDTKPEEE